MSEPQIPVKPLAKRYGHTFCAIGAGLVVLALLLQLIDAPLPMGLWVMLLASAFMLLLLGVGKLIEPDTSLVITPSSIRYVHRRGGWELPWEAIVRYDVPRVHRGLALEELPFIGFRLHDADELLAHISPRLAVHLIQEQRQLLIQALRHELPDEQDYTRFFDVPTEYKSPNGERYTGVMAMFATRMEQLRSLLGYDLYVSANALDRPLHEFCQHLQRLQQTRQNHRND